MGTEVAAMPEQRLKRWLTTSEAARLMNAHENTVRNWIKRGEVPARKAKRGKRSVYLIHERYVHDRRPRPSAEAQLVAEHVAKVVLEELGEVSVRLHRERDELLRATGRELLNCREALGAERERRRRAERQLKGQRPSTN
jgi:excisionase family DNA binding protein